jgi:uncharacterized protein YndB with AHSA1/START domain
MEKQRATLDIRSDLEVVLIRDFAAPRELVFEAWSKPEHVRRWFGLPNLELAVCEMDFRVGGLWRWVLRDPKHAMEHAFSGEYRQVLRPERLVYSERYEAIPNSDHEVTLTFTEHNGITTLRDQIVYQSVEHRDGHLASGMEPGMQVTFDRLEDMLATLRAA